MYSVNPKEGERFYLRLLLLHVPGATSFASLKIVNDEIYETFREACIARGILEGDDEWDRTLQEVEDIGTPRQLQHTFCFLLIHAELNNPVQLWTNHRDGMIQDFARTMNEANAEIAALNFIATVIKQSGKKLSDFSLPEVEELPPEPEIDAANMAQEAAQIRPTLNAEQVNAADTIISAVTNVHNNDNQNSRLFFLDSPGGTGKTYTINSIIKHLGGLSMKVATCAWTGIAATLLNKDSTVHSLFRLPVPVVETSTCNIKPTSAHAGFLSEQDLIVFDEVSMVPKHAAEAIDRMFRDITNNDTLFGGKVILLSGDFRQILPVVRKARPAEIIEVCLKSSYLWNSVTSFHLVRNMRARPEEQLFAQWLLDLGSKRLPLKPSEPYKDSIEIPERCIVPKEVSLCDVIFDDDNYTDKVILTTTNEDALKINEEILEKIPGEEKIYYSADDVVSDDVDEQDLYPQEFLNSLTPSGMPTHCLKLERGCVVTLLRNLDLKAVGISMQFQNGLSTNFCP